MNKLNKISWALAAMTIIAACSKSDEIPPVPPILPQESLTAESTSCKAIEIDTKLKLSAAASYQWSVANMPAETYSLTNTTAEKATFLATVAGSYQIQLTAKEGTQTYIRNVTVAIKEPATKLSPYIAKVIDLLPAPGQFTNDLPKYTTGDTREQMIKKAEEFIVGKKNGGLICLGGFGGYITFGFDHTIVNVQGKRDLRIMGNAFYANTNPSPDAPKGGSCEPGIIMVAYDANKNGVPDENEWYEIAGSEYAKSTTIKNYEITYFRPVSEEVKPVEGTHITINDYIKWEDNQGNSGYKVKNMYHNQSYYPSWIKEDKITFKGTLLPNNGIDESGNGSYWVLYAYGYGYADNISNLEDDSAIDISWAVDANGNKVELPGIDFVKVYTGVNQECGWLGENSTEIAGAYDLHLSGESIHTIK